jgi:hypothetical protein
MIENLILEEPGFFLLCKQRVLVYNVSDGY